MARALPSTLAERTFEALVLDWDAATDPTRGVAAGALGARIEALCAAGVHVVVVSTLPARELDERLGVRPAGCGQLHLCTGAEVHAVTSTGPAPVWTSPHERSGGRSGGAPAAACPALRWSAGWLAARGITGELILVAGLDAETAAVTGLTRAVVVSVGATPLLDLLGAQLERRGDRRVPSLDEDPAWVVALPEAPGSARAREALGTTANGWAGTRGTVEEDGAGTVALFVVNGVYANDERSSLLPGPPWTQLEVGGAPPAGSFLLDLRTGVLVRTVTRGPRLRTLRFASLARPHVLALRAEVGPGEQLAPAGSPASATATDGAARISVATHDWQEATDRATVVERVAAWAASTDGAATEPVARARGTDAASTGFDALLAEHRAAWAQRWAGAGVSITGAAGDELTARFAMFHLLSSAPDAGEAAVGARGLTGTAYGGHVFWDADVFVLPALAALHPPAARAMLEYRLRRLDAARATARAQEAEGARFPWESAASGTDVTPDLAWGVHGEPIAIRTGAHEEHIVADVAWAVDEYARWTGDEALFADHGARLIVETARYWASRIRTSDGAGHIYGVIGPDEYHVIVDDNAYTNVMARWNLRRAADLCEDGRLAAPAEVAHWRRLAEELTDGYDPDRGLYEQFAGYWGLEPLLATELDPPVAADVVLGAERVARSQIIKQADVLMLHHLVPSEVVPGSLAPNLAYYAPRTAHGSSLSPAISAALLARASEPDRALEHFRIAARLDLDDITGTTAGGLHLATMGGVWQALAYGFLGLRPSHRDLHVDPRLPAEWDALELRFRLHGDIISVRATHATVAVTCARPLRVRVGAAPAEWCDAPGATYELQGGPP